MSSSFLDIVKILYCTVVIRRDTRILFPPGWITYSICSTVIHCSVFRRDVIFKHTFNHFFILNYIPSTIYTYHIDLYSAYVLVIGNEACKYLIYIRRVHVKYPISSCIIFVSFLK